MSKDSNIQEFKQTLHDLARSHVKVQTAWVTVKTVDWDKKTMVATGIRDELDFPIVLLGLGSRHTKPKVNSKCLIGMIENLDAAAFLIDAEEVEEFVTTSGDSKITMNEDGFKIERNGISLTGIINDTLDAIIQSTYTNGAGTTSPPNNLTAFQKIKQDANTLLK